MRLLIAIAACLPSISAAADARVAAIVDALTGAFNNNEQVWQQGLDGVTPDPRQHWVLSRISEDTLDVDLAEGQTGDGNDWRFAFTLDEGVLVSAVLTQDGDGAGCRYVWQRYSDGYRGERQGRRRCDSNLPESLTINAGYLVAHHGDRIVQARRANAYSGWISLKRTHIDPEAADDDYIFLSGLSFHDEGYIARVLDDGEPTGYAVELANLTYQQTQIPILKIGVIDETTGKTVSYAWADQGAARIGINLRWIQAGLTAE